MGVGIKTFVVGPLEVNCYIIFDEDTREAMIVDPGDEPDRIEEALNKEGLKVKYIVCTHTHFDHVGAIPELKKATGAHLVIHTDEREIYAAAKDMAAFWGYELDDLPEPDLYLKEGDILKVGALQFQVLHTPGHSPGGMCLHGEDMVITGDTIFAGSVGRTDFHGGSMEKLKESFKRILDLPDETRILSGHGPVTSVEREKRENFFVSEL